MNAELGILMTTAFSVAVGHTLLGPDHYIPFVALARSNGWNHKKTIAITTLCGIGHVAGSVAIGAIGLILGTVLSQIEAMESFRGETAAWLLIGFGLAYLTWGIVQAVRDVPHTHVHAHADGTVHSHLHRHDLEHRHVHLPEQTPGSSTRAVTPWVLFLIFIFGPCEVLIPLLMYPAADWNLWGVAAVVLVFAIGTIGTMLACVLGLLYGARFLRLPTLHRYSHALAGGAVLVCGLLVKFGL